MQPLPQDPSYLLHLPVNVKSESTIPRVIGNAEKVKANQDLFKTVKNLFN